MSTGGRWSSKQEEYKMNVVEQKQVRKWEEKDVKIAGVYTRAPRGLSGGCFSIQNIK